MSEPENVLKMFHYLMLINGEKVFHLADKTSKYLTEHRLEKKMTVYQSSHQTSLPTWSDGGMFRDL